MRYLAALICFSFLTGLATAEGKLVERVERNGNHTTIVIKDTRKKPARARQPKEIKRAEPQQVDFKEYDVGANAPPAPAPSAQPTYTQAQNSTANYSQNYSQSYTPGPNRGMAANRGGATAIGNFTTGPIFGYGFPYAGYGFGPGFGPGFGFQNRGFRRGCAQPVQVFVPSNLVGLPQQRFAPVPNQAFRPIPVNNGFNGYRGGFNGYRGGGFRGRCR